MNIVKAYIKYKFRSKYRHGVHSPFVYNLQDKGFRIEVNNEFKKKFISFEKKTLKNTSTLEISDFGAGSKKLGNIRSIAQIYKNASAGKKYGFLLYKIVKHLQPKTILELGTSLGAGTVMMAEGNRNSKITTVEGCKNTFEEAKKTLSHFSLNERVKLVNSKFTDFIKEDFTVYDLIFIDGDHKSSSLLTQIELLKKNIHNDTLFIIDDIRWSDDMYAGWKAIKDNTEYNLTIDLFRMGAFAIRTQQTKEHFTLRF